MKVIVEAAHYIRRTTFSRGTVTDSISKLFGNDKLKLKVAAMKLLYKNEEDVMVDGNIFDAIYPQFNEEDRELLKTVLHSGQMMHTITSSVAVNVEPSLTVGALKSLLKREPWIPKENLVIVQQKDEPLKNDYMTLDDCVIKENNSVLYDYMILDDCGIKENNSVLLACMGGSFSLTVYDIRSKKEFIIPIDNCFETVGDLKKKIHQQIGHPQDDQVLVFQAQNIGKYNSVPLVACGIVRPYLSDMPEGLNRIKVFRGEDLYHYNPRVVSAMLGD